MVAKALILPCGACCYICPEQSREAGKDEEETQPWHLQLETRSWQPPSPPSPVPLSSLLFPPQQSTRWEYCRWSVCGCACVCMHIREAGLYMCIDVLREAAVSAITSAFNNVWTRVHTNQQLTFKAASSTLTASQKYRHLISYYVCVREYL